MLILEIDRRASAGNGNAGTRGDVITGKIRELRQMVDVPRRREAGGTYINDRNTVDGERVRVLAVLETTVTPRIADSRSDTAAFQSQRGVGRVAVGDGRG